MPTALLLAATAWYASRVNSPAPVAGVTAFRWRSPVGQVHTTVVGKLTFQLTEEGFANVAPEPFIAFDRIAADTRFIEEAGELMPWATVGSIVAYGGPLRAQLFPASQLPGSAAGAALSAATAGPGPVGLSLSSPERSALAPQRPTRGPDGLMHVPKDLDGRYFVAAPLNQRGPLLRGDERYQLELRGRKLDGRLPGITIEVTIGVGAEQRVLSLAFDILSINATTLRASLVGRAVVPGEAVILKHTARSSVAASVRANPRAAADLAPSSVRPRPENTAEINSSDVRRLRAASPTPFVEEPSFDDEPTSIAGAPPAAAAAATPAARASQPALPATPFDQGFRAGQVVPAGGITETLSPYEGLDSQLLLAAAQLRREAKGLGPIPQPPPAASAAGPLPTPTFEGPAVGKPTPPEPTASGQSAAPAAAAKVAPPKPGAMAKPRVRRR